MDIKDGVLEWDVMNPRTGLWETFGERFHLDKQFVWQKTPTEEDPEVFNTKISLTLKGLEPLLINVTPSAVTRIGHVMPKFVKAVTFQPVEESSAGYQAVNLTGGDVELVFYRDNGQECKFQDDRGRECSSRRLEPTGAKWKGIGLWIQPFFAKKVAMRLPGESNRLSWPLPLDSMGGAVGVPGSKIILELRMPDPTRRLLFVSTAVRVHNTTDLPMLVRFHVKNGDDSVLADVSGLEFTSKCDATYLGGEIGERNYSSSSAEGSMVPERMLLCEDSPTKGAVRLDPNMVCVVPEACIFYEIAEKSHGQLARPRAWISIKPLLDYVSFSKEMAVGDYDAQIVVIGSQAGMAPRTVQCKRTTGENHLNFICEGRSEVHFLPSATSVATIALRPTFALLNAMPFGSLMVSYAPTSGAQAERIPAKGYTDVKLQSLWCLNLYNLPGVLTQGICLRVRLVVRDSETGEMPDLDSNCPWSRYISFARNAHEEDSTKFFGIRQSKDGADATLAVEASAQFEIRFSCPCWFVDRSGMALEATLAVELQKSDQ
jgi:hypothetical protein